MEEVLLKIIEESCKKLYMNDGYLIRKHIHERAIVFRFGIYIQRRLSRNELLKQYNLDCEYNKNGNDIKSLPQFPNGTMPDLIIHKRGSNYENILIIECKTENDPDTDRDIEKIKAFVDIDQDYKFKYGMSILFLSNEVVIKIIQHDRNDIEKHLYLKCN